MASRSCGADGVTVAAAQSPPTLRSIPIRGICPGAGGTCGSSSLPPGGRGGGRGGPADEAPAGIRRETSSRRLARSTCRRPHGRRRSPRAGAGGRRASRRLGRDSDAAPTRHWLRPRRRHPGSGGTAVDAPSPDNVTCARSSGAGTPVTVSDSDERRRGTVAQSRRLLSAGTAPSPAHGTPCIHWLPAPAADSDVGAVPDCDLGNVQV